MRWRIIPTTQEQAKQQAQRDAEQVPEELRCPVTKSLFRDAVLLPCCGVSISDDAIGQVRVRVRVRVRVEVRVTVTVMVRG